MHLRLFKDNGRVRYDRTLQIPSSERIAALTQTDAGYEQVYTVLVLNLQQALAGLNVKRGINEDQLLELADMVIEEAKEDNLSMEDVMLFLQQLVTGKSGKIYDRLDIPVFFELFEVYRQERHLALQYIQYETDCHYKALGDTTRTSDGLADNDTNTRRVMAEYYSKQQNNAQSEPVQPPPAT